MCLRFFHKTSWRAVGAGFAVTAVVLWAGVFMLLENDPRQEDWYLKPAPCQISDKMMMDMILLTFEISRILTSHSIPHTLCYGTLWGALRMGKLLPWDNNVDFCVRAVDAGKLNSAEVWKAFNDKDLLISHNGRLGYYKVEYGQGLAFINVFQKMPNGELAATGWKHKYLWFLPEKPPSSFPDRLMEPPFPKAKLYNHDFPVPHEEVEILKYLYASNWWLEVKPPGC